MMRTLNYVLLQYLVCTLQQNFFDTSPRIKRMETYFIGYVFLTFNFLPSRFSLTFYFVFFVTELLAATCAGEVNNNAAAIAGSSASTSTSGSSGNGVQGVVGSGKESTRLCQPAVGVAAVAASCKACHPQGFLQPQQRAAVQQPWPGVTAPAVASGGGRHRGRAVEPGPEHAATSSSSHRRQAANAAAVAAGVPWARAAKRSRVSTPGTAPWPPACCKACQQWNQDNSRVLWNNDNMLRLFQV